MPPNKTNPPIAEDMHYHLPEKEIRHDAGLNTALLVLGHTERPQIKQVFQMKDGKTQRIMGETFDQMPEGLKGSLDSHEPLFTEGGRQILPLNAERWQRQMELRAKQYFDKFTSPHDALASELMHNTCRIDVKPDSNRDGIDLNINADYDHHMQPVLEILANAFGGDIFTKVDYSTAKGYGNGTRHYMLKNIPNGPEVIRKLTEAIRNIPPRMNPLKENYPKEALRSFSDVISKCDPERQAAIQYVDENNPGYITVRFGLQEDMEGIDTSDYQEGTQPVKVDWLPE